MDSKLTRQVLSYRQLLVAFLAGAIPAAAFAREFEERYLADTTAFPQEIFDVLEALFGAADSFVGDERLRAQLRSDRPSMYVDEDQLRQAALTAAVVLWTR